MLYSNNVAGSGAVVGWVQMSYGDTYRSVLE
jgi:hypothetical protein